MLLRPPTPTLFPYTTLFRSHPLALRRRDELVRPVVDHAHGAVVDVAEEHINPEFVNHYGDVYNRSEEHTSELQSPYDLVCRLLLEKKKKKNTKARCIVRSNK